MPISRRSLLGGAVGMAAGLGLAATGSAAAPAEGAAEDVVEHREDVADVHVGKVVLAVDAAVAELVVAAALLGVGEDLVGFGAFFELELGFGFVAVGAVGVVLHRLAAIGALDLLAVCCFSDAKDFVIVSFDRSHSLVLCPWSFVLCPT